ncbi:MAG: efflux RND transporter periplasmic adaptor subunit [Leptothrix sp. (in: b-proteobacteria)]
MTMQFPWLRHALRGASARVQPLRPDPARRRLAGGLVGKRLAQLVLLGALAAPLQGAQAQTVAPSQDFVGIVYPVRDAMLSVHVAGVVEQVTAQVGQRVTAGQTLLLQDARLQAAEVERRRIVWQDNAELLSTEERRRIIEDLVKNADALFQQAGTISREEVLKLRLELVTVTGRIDQLRESKKREEAELAFAQRERDMRALVAPMAGVVTLIKLHPGEWAAPGEPILRLVDDTSCELRVNVSQAAARRLSTGARVAVKVDDPALPGELAGRVSFVSPVIDPASSLVEVRVQIGNAERRVRPGVKARLRIEGAL